jgi:hypothetical protein
MAACQKHFFSTLKVKIVNVTAIQKLFASNDNILNAFSTEFMRQSKGINPELIRVARKCRPTVRAI